MSNRATAPAQLPPPGITGLDPEWSRLVTSPDAFGVDRTWHLLDSWAERQSSARPLLTLLCVHGNPSWSFLWRKLVSTASSDDIRVIAVDQLDMGFSERTGRKRTLATRVEDLNRLTETLALTGLVVTVAHDWGGPISLGWALRHVDTSPISGPRLAGVVLTNTAVHQPSGSPAPSAIRLIRSKPVLRQSTVNSLTFIRGAYEMSRPRLPPEVREGFTAPYLERGRREAIADFVADIPLDPSHESAATLDGIAAGLTTLADVPTLLLWGPRDQVFGDLYLHDLEARLPHAKVHRFVNASHFVGEDADVAGAVTAWLPTLNPSNGAGATTGGSDHQNRGSQTRGLADFSGVDVERVAVVEMAKGRLDDQGEIARSITFGELTDQVERLAAGMASHGIEAGDRVAVMVPPGIDLSLAVYACWRRGATLVLVDSGLGPKGMQQALLSADPDHLIGIDKALAAAKAMRWPGKRIAVGPRSKMKTKALGITTDLDALAALGEAALANSSSKTVPRPGAEMFAAIAFTSGATGPSKGVVYRHHQIQAQRDALMELYGLTPNDRLVAAFAPFALYGPTMGLTSVVPDMDVTAPGTLTASALGDAVAAIDATLVFASPAALVNTMSTAGQLSPAHHSAFEAVRLLLSAGAPVRPELLRSVKTLFPNASAHTPYGMTETLPVADISLTGIDAASDGDGDGDGVCVGLPLPTVEVMIDPLDRSGRPVGAPSTDPGLLGEIIVRAPHARDGYDRLWFTQHQASQPAGWHRTGDIGRLDTSGRLWVGGRLGHVITPASGPIAPVRHEQLLEQLPDIDAAAVVGVGPPGAQVVVAVVESKGPAGGVTLDLLDRARAHLVAAEITIDLAAVLTIDDLPVDRRHNSKIDRSAVANMGSHNTGRQQGWRTVRVLVTGATSMIGASVVDLLLARGDDVTVMQRNPSGRTDVVEVTGDVSDPAAVDRAAARIDGVIHLAAKVGVTGDWSEYESINIEGTRTVIAGARAAGANRFVHISTPSVAHAGSALVGAHAEPAQPHHVRGHYARSKAIAEQHALAENSSDFPVIALRPHLVWGPGDTQLVQRIIDRARAGRLALVGSGLALIDTTYVDNASSAMVAALDRAPDIGGRALVISNGQPRTVAEILQRILVAAGLPPEIKSVPASVAIAAGAVAETIWARTGRDDDPPMTRFLAEQLSTAHWFDQRETQRLLQWHPQTSLDAGFERLQSSFGVATA